MSIPDVPEILSFRSLPDIHLNQLRAVSPHISVSQIPTDDPAEMVAALTLQTTIIFTLRCDFDTQLAPALRWVQLESAGVNQVHDTPLWHSDITITTANGIHAIQITELVMGLLLALGRQLPRATALQQQHIWATGATLTSFIPNELFGKTIGILGYGAIGRHVARLSQSFGMRVLATSRTNTSHSYDGWTIPGTGDPQGEIPAAFYGMDELDSLLPQCDILISALPLTTATRGLLNANTLAFLPKHAWIVNVGRGPVIDHTALTEALEHHRLGGAALDVTDPEPLPAEHALWHLPNVIITPHIAGLSQHYNQRITELFATNVRRFLNDEPLLNRVQRELGY